MIPQAKGTFTVKEKQLFVVTADVEKNLPFSKPVYQARYKLGKGLMCDYPPPYQGGARGGYAIIPPLTPP